LILFACSKTDIEYDDNLQKEFSFGHEGLNVLANPTHMTSDNKNIFVSDPFKSEIFHYDLSGNFIKIIGSFGKGPDELSHQSVIHVNNSQLFIEDQGNKRVKLTNIKGEVDSIFLNKSSFIEFTVFSDKIYAFSPESFRDVNIGNYDLISVYDFNGVKLDSFGDLIGGFAPNIPAGVSWPFLKIENNLLHVLFNYFPIYRIYDLKGNLLNEYDLSAINENHMLNSNFEPEAYDEFLSPDIKSVYKALYVHNENIYAARLTVDELLIEKYRLINRELSFEKNFTFRDQPNNYYLIDFSYSHEAKSFYVLEKSDVPKVTKYRILN